LQLNEQPPNAPEIEDEIANLSAAMTLIHLTQTIYFQPNPTAIMAEDLMHWVNRLDSSPDPVEGQQIMRSHPASHHPSYWTFLHKYLILCKRNFAYSARAVSRGLFKVAISCLRAEGLVEHDSVDQALLDHIVHVLNTAPLGKQSQLARRANELWDLKNAWRQWHANLE